MACSTKSDEIIYMFGTEQTIWMIGRNDTRTGRGSLLATYESPAQSQVVCRL